MGRLRAKQFFRADDQRMITRLLAFMTGLREGLTTRVHPALRQAMDAYSVRCLRSKHIEYRPDSEEHAEVVLAALSGAYESALSVMDCILNRF